MTILQRQREAAQAARDECVADGKRDHFDRRYRAECHDRGVNADESPDSPAQSYCPNCYCRSCQRVREMQRIRGGISRLDEETEQLSRRMTHETWAATFEHERQQRAASAAQQRCEDEAKPERFNRYYREELKRA